MICRKCKMVDWKEGIIPVPGKGNRNADIMFVGEAPGKDENASGEPFVGMAGQVLEKHLKRAGIERASVFITNIVKCQPPGNRNPTYQETVNCGEKLEAEIMEVKPKLIVALGRISIGHFVKKKNISMIKLHGKVAEIEVNGIVIKILMSYHPAAELYNPVIEQAIDEDFAKIRELIE